MLSTLRSFAKSRIFQALLLLLIASFAIWGVGDIFRGGQRVDVAEVGDVAISDAQFQERLQDEISRMQRLFGGRLNVEDAIATGLPEQVIESMVATALWDVEARDLQLAVSPEQVARWVRNNPNFAGPDGTFDRTIFERALQVSGMNEESFVQLMTQDFRRSQLADAVQGGALAPEPLVDALYRHREERRAAEVIYIAIDAIDDLPAPTEEELAEFHTSHAEMFTKPETRSVTALMLQPSTVVDEIAVSDEDIAAAYDDRRDEFVTSEQRVVEQVLAGDEEVAKTLVERTRAGEDFAEVAEELTGGAPIDLGAISEDDPIMEDVAQTAFTLSVGTVSDPEQSPFGWRVLRVTEIVPAGEQTIDEVRDELRRDIAMERSVDVLVGLAEQLEDELAGGASLEEAAQAVDLSVTTVAAIDRAGEDGDGNAVEGLPAGTAFAESAFATEPGQESPMTETDEGGYFILRVDGVTPSALRPLDEVRDQVADAWEENARQEAAAQAAEDIVERLGGVEDLRVLADDAGYAYLKSEPVTRAETPELPTEASAFTSKLFALSPGEAAAVTGAEGALVVRLAEVSEPEAADSGEGARSTIVGSIGAAINADIAEQFSNALRDSHGVVIRQDAIDRLVRGGETN